MRPAIRVCLRLSRRSGGRVVACRVRSVPEVGAEQQQIGSLANLHTAYVLQIRHSEQHHKFDEDEKENRWRSQEE
jgi:hypothetical protein